MTGDFKMEKTKKSQRRVGELGGGRDNVDGCTTKPAQSVAFDGIIDFRTFSRHHFGSPPTDARRTAAERAAGCEIFRMPLFGLPSIRNCVAGIR